MDEADLMEIDFFLYRGGHTQIEGEYIGGPFVQLSIVDDDDSTSLYKISFF